MNREAIIDGLTQDILAYAMNGGFSQRELAESLKFEALDERFADYELLVDLHFLLKPEVIDFVEQLSQRIRNVRTETTSVARTQRGGIDGHINWGATVKTRYATNPSDRSLFVTEHRSEDYDIPENLVLKKLLSVIYTTLRETDEYLRAEYDWVADRWHDNRSLIDDVQRTVDRNVHVRRIREPDAYEPTERMLTTAANARQAIYRDAAALLRTRDRLHDGHPEELRQLLTETAITPDDQAKLFELYVLFRFIATLEELQDTPPTFQTITRGRDEVARFNGDREVVIYHDDSGGDRGLSFRTEANPDDRELTRAEQVQQTARSVASNYFDTQFRNHTGRPDVLALEVKQTDPLQYEYLIAEVKHSTREETIRTGIKETLEYLAFLRVNEEFVFGNEGDTDPQYFGSGWNGLLVVQDLEQETPSVADQHEEPITILQAGELDAGLKTVLRELLESGES